MSIIEKKKKISLFRSKGFFGRSKKIGEYEANTMDEAVEKYAHENPHVEITVVKHYKIGEDDILHESN